MRRRSKAAGEPAKAQRRKTAVRKRGNGLKTRRRSPSIASLETKVAQLTRELKEALQRQTGASEILSTISNSRGELQPVFNVILENATRICKAQFGVLYLCDADALRAVAATKDAPPAYLEARKRELRLQPSPDSPIGRAAITKQVAQVADLRRLQSYRERHPFVVAAVELGGFRTALGVPILQDNELVGAITILRQEVQLFTNKQIELIENFAAQAVIAIENTQLLNDLRQRTADLTESLEQQTATAEVLQVISSSPGDLEPVFEAMLESAVRICGARFGNLWLREGDFFRIGATTQGTPVAYVDFLRRDGPFRADPRIGLGRLLRRNNPTR